jgi:hypothetical protein
VLCIELRHVTSRGNCKSKERRTGGLQESNNSIGEPIIEDASFLSDELEEE